MYSMPGEDGSSSPYLFRALSFAGFRSLSKSNTRTAAVLVDELDAGHLIGVLSFWL